MLFAFIPLKKLVLGQPIKPIEYVLYALAMVYATNTEQLLVIIFPILVLFIILKNDKTNFFVYIELFIVIAMMFFVILTPGNYARLMEDARVWFPDFLTLSYPKLLELGLSSSLYHYFYKPSSLFLAFYVLLSCVIWNKSNLLAKLSVSFVGAVVLIFGYFSDFARNAMTVYGYISPHPYPFSNLLLFFLLIFTAVCLIYCIWAAFDGGKVGLECIGVLVLGFITRMTVSFAPSIWGSQTRTFVFLNFALICCAVMLFTKLKETAFLHYKALYIFIGVLCGLCLLFFLIQILPAAPFKDFVDGYLIPKYDLKGWEMAVVSISKEGI
jgi:hypothetical protein